MQAFMIERAVQVLTLRKQYCSPVFHQKRVQGPLSLSRISLGMILNK